MAKLSCQVCGAEYRGKPKSSYCSTACAGVGKSKHADEARAKAVKVCRECSKPYKPRYGQWWAFRDSKYCSLECANSGKQQTIDAIENRLEWYPETGCLVWLGHKNVGGYGLFRSNGKRSVVHRILWELKNGPVPEGLQLDHICKNPACCNLKHLRAVTPQVNVLYSDNACARNARKQVCPKCGGAYAVHSDGQGRYCKSCTSEKATQRSRQRYYDDPEFRERQRIHALEYQEKLKNNPDAIDHSRGRPRNEVCPKCGGPYGSFPNGNRYCMTCRNAWQRARDARRKAESNKEIS